MQTEALQIIADCSPSFFNGRSKSVERVSRLITG